jgi:GntR family transcriptional regulator
MRASAAIKLHRDSAVPLYKQLAALLLAQISDGSRKPGERLPSEPALMAEFGVSRVTVRQAIALLARSGKASAHHGKGTFVASRLVRHDLDALHGFYDSLRSQGVEPETRLLEWSVDGGALDGAPPPGAQLPVRLRRLYLVEGKPFAVVTGYLPAAAASLGRERAERLMVYDILSEYLQTVVTRAEVTIRCCKAPTAIGRLLGVGRTGLVLMMERQSFARAPDPCEFMQIHIVPEHYEFRLSVAGQLELARGVRQVHGSVSPIQGATHEQRL